MESEFFSWMVAFFVIVVGLILFAVLSVVVVSVAAVASISLWALVKPRIRGLCDRWMDWVERRLG